MVYPLWASSAKAMESFPHVTGGSIHNIGALGTSARPPRVMEITRKPPANRR